MRQPPKILWRQAFTFQALNDNPLHHAIPGNGVTLVTALFESWYAKKSGPGGPLIMFRNRWGRSRLKGSPTASLGLCGRILPLLSQLFSIFGAQGAAN